jgi:hypothetical protein
MSNIDWGPVIQSQRLRAAHQVLNLAAIQSPMSQFVELGVIKTKSFMVIIRNTLNEGFPHLSS